MDSQGLADDNARKLCAYIGRRAGKIKSLLGVAKALEGEE